MRSPYQLEPPPPPRDRPPPNDDPPLDRLLLENDDRELVEELVVDGRVRRGVERV